MGCFATSKSSRGFAKVQEHLTRGRIAWRLSCQYYPDPNRYYMASVINYIFIPLWLTVCKSIHVMEANSCGLDENFLDPLIMAQILSQDNRWCRFGEILTSDKMSIFIQNCCRSFTNLTDYRHRLKTNATKLFSILRNMGKVYRINCLRK